MANRSDRAAEQAAYSLARHAKLLCSAVFVVGRNPYEYIEHDLRSLDHYHDWDHCSVDIDFDAQTVTLTGRGGVSKTAIYHPSQGCTILSDDTSGVYFDPVRVMPDLPAPSEQDWPMGDRNAVATNPDGVDTEALSTTLDRATRQIPPQGMPPNTRAVVVIKDGRIVGERYASGYNKHTRHVSWSMGKSVTSALIGILINEGHFDVDDPAPIDAWQDDARSQITIADLLRMSSGLEFRRSTDEPDVPSTTAGDHHHRVYCEAMDVFDFVTSRPLEHEPNTVWRYRNCDTLSLGKIIRDTVEDTGREYLSFPQRALYDKIGVRHMVHEPDPYGNFIMTGFNYGTARDWARFGLLHLQEGKWQGEQLFPDGWIDFITEPAPAHPDDGYGGQFWLNQSQEFPEVPADAYGARGARGQITMVIPSLDMVIVRLGHTPHYDAGHHNALVREIINCVET
ncbi:MAG: serine hydrolase domain-containing protein [Halobacteriales archaeon]